KIPKILVFGKMVSLKILEVRSSEITLLVCCIIIFILKNYCNRTILTIQVIISGTMPPTKNVKDQRAEGLKDL
ncbi:MAG: hypothetical protein K940chlam7_01909, partial [Chlamydiae bacterium]|nr:hypothetical protein [Chlamydiota bacterium]